MNTQIMGILNVTPDSFSDGGRFGINGIEIDKVLKTAEEMITDGAAILDIGGESTRPDGASVSAEEEIERVVPVIEAIKKNFNTVISVDTYKAVTAKEAVKAGASIINDIGFMKFDSDMGKTAASLGVEYILMHNVAPKIIDEPSKDNKSSALTAVESGIVNPKLKTGDYGESYVNRYFEELNMGIEEALKAGILKDNLIIDPGIGFNKTYEQNLAIMAKMDKLCKLGYPVLLGVSRKSVIGNTLGLPVDERLEGTIATSVMAALSGVKYLRVHDVKENTRAVRMAEKLLEYGYRM